MRLTLILLFFCSSAFAFTNGDVKNKPAEIGSVKTSINAETLYPVPPASADRLFYVQRTSNFNTIIYDLNIGSNGKPDADEPVKVYWIKYADKGQREGLSYIQRKFAYGLTSKALDNDKYDIRFVSYKKFQLTLMKSADGKYHIFASVNQKQILLNRIFVKIEGGSFWLPNVLYVEVNGTDQVTGKEIVERFKP